MLNKNVNKDVQNGFLGKMGSVASIPVFVRVIFTAIGSCIVPGLYLCLMLLLNESYGLLSLPAFVFALALLNIYLIREMVLRSSFPEPLVVGCALVACGYFFGMSAVGASIVILIGSIVALGASICVSCTLIEYLFLVELDEDGNIERL